MSTFDLTERAVDGGSPRELFLFVQGTTTYAYTSADSTIVLGGTTYAKEAVSSGPIDYSQEEGSGGAEIHLPAKNTVAQKFKDYPPSTPVFVTIFRVHRNGAAAVRFVGRVSQGSFEGAAAKLTCAPLRGLLTRAVPGLNYQKQCNWPLYGPGCGLLAAAFRDSAAISAVNGLLVSSPAFSARPPGWFAFGRFELNGERRYILEHAGDTVTLIAPIPGLDVGAQVDVFAGCDRSETTCKVKFNNLVRFLGFTRIPNNNPYVGRMS